MKEEQNVVSEERSVGSVEKNAVQDEASGGFIEYYPGPFPGSECSGK